MKYWFFDGNDVVGPFTAKELVENKSFSAASLICPENFSDDGDHWQPAALFAEIKTLLTQNEPSQSAVTFEEEMATLLKERSPLSFDESPAESPSLEIPQKPSKPGPIEDYFNNIKEEDLGDILGIPDPNDNSDMDLAHALEKQLAKTSSTRRKQREENKEEKEVPSDPLDATHHIATITEVFGAAPQTTQAEHTLPPLPSSTLPVLTDEEKPVLPLTTNEPTADTLKSTLPQEAASQNEPGPADSKDFVQPIQEPSQEPSVVSDENSSVHIIPDPALLRAEKVEVNSVRARLKQTQEMKDFLNETQNSHLKKQYRAQRKIMIILLVALAIMIALVCVMQLKKHASHAPARNPASVTNPASAYTQELLTEESPSSATLAQAASTPATPAAEEPSQEKIALSVVQNYTLSGNRGTIGNYLNRLYKTQLEEGYSASWGVEPLYKDTYIVKYRLTKTRKEPIIYVFQANVAARKLTGALNNVSLDLVGKI